jgi:tetratricopeptide (TPR) repeat protein
MIDQRQTLVDYETQSFFWDRYMTIGKQAFENRRLVEAIRMFMLALKSAMTVDDKAQSVQSMSWMALVYYEWNNFAEAERLLKQVIIMAADRPEIEDKHQHYKLMGLVLEGQGKYKEAQETYVWLLNDCRRRGLTASDNEYRLLVQKHEQAKSRLPQVTLPPSAAVWDFSAVN